nr:MAG TPA: hypothetical protein [Caudoviricetes sp.]
MILCQIVVVFCKNMSYYVYNVCTFLAIYSTIILFITFLQ